MSGKEILDIVIFSGVVFLIFPWVIIALLHIRRWFAFLVEPYSFMMDDIREALGKLRRDK